MYEMFCVHFSSFIISLFALVEEKKCRSPLFKYCLFLCNDLVRCLLDLSCTYLVTQYGIFVVNKSSLNWDSHYSLFVAVCSLFILVPYVGRHLHLINSMAFATVNSDI